MYLQKQQADSLQPTGFVWNYEDAQSLVKHKKPQQAPTPPQLSSYSVRKNKQPHALHPSVCSYSVRKFGLCQEK